MTDTAGLEQPPAPPWSDLGDSRDLAAVVRRAYGATPAAVAPHEPAAEAPAGDPLALLRRESAARPERAPVPAGTIAAALAAAAAVAVLLLTGAPGALLDRFRPSVAAQDLPPEPAPSLDATDEPAIGDAGKDAPFTYDSTPPSTASPSPAPAGAAATAPAAAGTSRRRTATSKRSSTQAPSPATTAAPARSAATTVPPTQQPPEDPPDDGTPAGGGW